MPSAKQTNDGALHTSHSTMSRWPSSTVPRSFGVAIARTRLHMLPLHADGWTLRRFIHDDRSLPRAALAACAGRRHGGWATMGIGSLTR